MSSFSLIQKHSAKILWFTGLAVFVWSIFYVVQTLFIHPGKYVDFSVFFGFDLYRIFGLLFFIGCIAVANWAIESYKWWYMVQGIQTISYKTAVKSVLMGLAIGFITPNRLGDYPGRAILFQKEERAKVVLMNLLSGYAQFTIICLLALLSVLIYPIDFSAFFHTANTYAVWYTIFFAMLFIYHITFLFFPQWYLNGLYRLKPLARLKPYLHGFAPLRFAENITVLHFSFLRSLLYTIQLLVIFYYLVPGLPLITVFLYANVYFFILTVAPSFMLNKLGIRESISLLVFSPVIDNPVVIVVSVLLLWIINQVLPAIFGAYLLITKKH